MAVRRRPTSSPVYQMILSSEYWRSSHSTVCRCWNYGYDLPKGRCMHSCWCEYTLGFVDDMFDKYMLNRITSDTIPENQFSPIIWKVWLCIYPWQRCPPQIISRDQIPNHQSIFTKEFMSHFQLMLYVPLVPDHMHINLPILVYLYD